MSTVDEWLNEYAAIRAFAPSRTTDWVTIPLLVASLVGLLWSVPVPDVFSRSSPVLNWGTLFLMAAVVYYFILSITLAIGALPLVLGASMASAWLDARLDMPLWLVSGTVFSLVAVWQMLDYSASGKRPPVFKYFQFVMIAPLWLLAAAYRRLGIPY
jgi:uncharacterized membrane protein YGL010W